MQINGNDHFVVDSIIWQYTNVGVEINGAANLLQGVHAWGSGCGPSKPNGVLVSVSARS